jgi:hypothetical protein
MTSQRPLDFGPWLWGARADLALFGGSALLALGLVALGNVTGLSAQAFPEWAFLAFVIGVDVAHVHSTWFRTYFDRQELGRHPLRYTLVPLVGYAAGVLLYSASSAHFWRALAYLAIVHFVRQQAGWVALYRARSGRAEKLDVWVDGAAIYASTLYPMLHWHAHANRRSFGWLVDGDVVFLDALRAVMPFAQGLWVTALLGFAARQLQLRLKARRIDAGKCVVVLSTAACWYVGIVHTQSDFDFTVTNVLIHGVPYVALLWAYARERRGEAPRSAGSRIAQSGVFAFLGVLLALAFAEEAFWDGLVWREHAELFGENGLFAVAASAPALTSEALRFLVPLLALPQLTHYVLDGFLWRRSETRARKSQRRALGFAAETSSDAPELSAVR